MSRRDRMAAWQDVLDLSGTMLLHARAGEWDALNALAAERQRNLEAFFADPVAPGEAAGIEEGIHKINAIDGEITLLARSAHGDISQAQEMLKKRQQASRAYTDPEFHQS